MVYKNKIYLVAGTTTTALSGSGGTELSLYRLNAGGGTVTNSLGTFAADQNFSPVPGNVYATTSGIGGTADAAIYQTERYGSSFGYTFPASSGQQYKVILHFAEVYFTGIGQRVFDVSIEGNKVLDNYDINKNTGPFTATNGTFTVSVADDALNINFSSLAADGGVDNAKISAIEVLKVSAPGNPPPTPAPVANAGPDQVLTQPTSTTTLAASGTAASGNTITAYAWSQVGTTPAVAGFSSKTVATPVISALTAAGTYTFALVVTNNLGKSSVADQVAVTVNPAPPTSGQQVVSFTLIDAGTDQPIRTMMANEVLYLASLPESLAIRAPTSPASVGSVTCIVSGAASRTTTDNTAPYALFGDANGKYKAWTPSPLPGSYTLRATPYTASGGGGTAGTPLTLSFSVSNGAATAAVAQAALSATALPAVAEQPGAVASAEVFPNSSRTSQFSLRLPEAFRGRCRTRSFRRWAPASAAAPSRCAVRAPRIPSIFPPSWWPKGFTTCC